MKHNESSATNWKDSPKWSTQHACRNGSYSSLKMFYHGWGLCRQVCSLPSHKYLTEIIWIRVNLQFSLDECSVSRIENVHISVIQLLQLTNAALPSVPGRFFYGSVRICHPRVPDEANHRASQDQKFFSARSHQGKIFRPKTDLTKPTDRILWPVEASTETLTHIWWQSF